MKGSDPRTKREVLEDLLDRGMVLVALDARKPGVDVPLHLVHDVQLRLNLSYRFGLPMNIDDWGVRATLTFNGVPYDCSLPWPSIFLVVSHVSGEPVLFPDSIPLELLGDAAHASEGERESTDDDDMDVPSRPGTIRAARRGPLGLAAAKSKTGSSSRTGSSSPSVPSRPRLVLVSDSDDQTSTPSEAPKTPVLDTKSPGDEPTPPASPQRGKKRTHLRLVKS